MALIEGEKQSTIIPKKEELKKILKCEYKTSHKQDSPKGSNCDTEIINYINEKWENIKIFLKKSYLKGIEAEICESEYLTLKKKLKNIIPNQSFISFWNWTVFAFCAPIFIKADIFESENHDYILAKLRENKKLVKQIKFFIRWFKDLLKEWKNIDLYWKENLVISDDNKLYYVDSFLVFHDTETIKKDSLKNIEYLEYLLSEI